MTTETHVSTLDQKKRESLLALAVDSVNHSAHDRVQSIALLLLADAMHRQTLQMDTLIEEVRQLREVIWEGGQK